MTSRACLTACRTEDEVARNRMSRQCRKAAGLSAEHRQLTTKLALWHQQIKHLVQSQAGPPTRAKAGRHDAENQAPLPAQTAAAQSTVVAGSQSQTSDCGGSTPAPLHSVQSGHQLPSPVQQLRNVASRKHCGTQPTALGAHAHQQATSLTCEAAMCAAEMRRKRMRERLQAAEVRRAKANEHVEVP